MDFFEQMEARIPHGEVRTRFAPSPRDRQKYRMPSSA